MTSISTTLSGQQIERYADRISHESDSQEAEFLSERINRSHKRMIDRKRQKIDAGSLESTERTKATKKKTKGSFIGFLIGALIAAILIAAAAIAAASTGGAALPAILAALPKAVGAITAGMGIGSLFGSKASEKHLDNADDLGEEKETQDLMASHFEQNVDDYQQALRRLQQTMDQRVTTADKREDKNYKAISDMAG